MPASNAQNDTTLNHFFTVLNDATSSHYQDLDYLMQQVFCPSGNPTTTYPSGSIPACGITDHGPQFIGDTEVRLLFQTIFTAFPDFRSLPQVAPGVPSKRMYSQDQTMIAIQTTISGTQKARWFQDKFGPGGRPGHYSPPISDIQPDGKHAMQLPVANVMIFDTNGKIVQLSMYFDRYLMNIQLKTALPVAQADVFVHIIEAVLEKRPL
jgi:hypothetical protein